MGKEFLLAWVYNCYKVYRIEVEHKENPSISEDMQTFSRRK